MTDFTISPFKIGVDGGGTKTELILVDASGAIVATHTAPGCNPSQCGPEKAREIILTGLEVLLAAAPVSGLRPPVSDLQLYMAGSPALWTEIAATLTGYGRVVTAADSLPVLELATSGSPGLVLHAGTGSFVAARAPDGSVHYAGGLGWKFGDAGSGFDLGRRGVTLALQELQGWSKATSLGEALKAHTGLADYAAHSRFFYNDPAANAAIAGFAPRVLDLAGHGNGPARTALATSLTDLVALGQLVTGKLFGATRVSCGVSGSILNREPANSMLKTLVTGHHWPVDLHFITAPPIEGVRRLLAKEKS